MIFARKKFYIKKIWQCQICVFIINMHFICFSSFFVFIRIKYKIIKHNYQIHMYWDSKNRLGQLYLFKLIIQALLCNSNFFNIFWFSEKKVGSQPDSEPDIIGISDPCMYSKLTFDCRFGLKRKPIYINMVRNPLDRLVSFYYFTRNGDDIRPSRERAKERTMEVWTDWLTGWIVPYRNSFP